jgi:RNA polymerase sigma-70 factor (ECF subfamily)
MLLNVCMVSKHILPKRTSGAADEPGSSFEDLLLAAGKPRDKESFMALFQYFAPRVKSFLIKGGIGEAQADELAQETMLAVWQNAENYDPKRAKASTWIYTIARNKRIDALRKVKYIEVDQDDPLYTAEDEREPADEVLAHSEEEEALDEMIAALPEEQAFLIRKSFYEDKSHAVIAAETGIALGTVKSRIRQALDSLRGEEKVRELWH